MYENPAIFDNPVGIGFKPVLKDGLFILDLKGRLQVFAELTINLCAVDSHVILSCRTSQIRIGRVSDNILHLIVHFLLSFKYSNDNIWDKNHPQLGCD